jgi:hypothetical protein
MNDTVLQPAVKGLRPAYPFGFALLCFALMLYTAYEYIYMRGIPADRINNVDAAWKSLALWFEGISLAVAVWFIYLGNAAARTQIKGRFWLGVVLYIGVVLAMLFIGSIMAADLLC